MYNQLAQAYIPLLTLPNYAKIHTYYIEAAKNACERCLEYYQQASECISESSMVIRLPSLTLSNVLLHSETSFHDIIKLIQKYNDPEIKTPSLSTMLQRMQKNVTNISTQSSLHIEQHIERQKAARVPPPAKVKMSWWSLPSSFSFCPPSCSANAVNENAHRQPTRK